MTFALAMPPKTGPGLIGPDGDVYYAVFVAVVLLATVVGCVILFRRWGREQRGDKGPEAP